MGSPLLRFEKFKYRLPSSIIIPPNCEIDFQNFMFMKRGRERKKRKKTVEIYIVLNLKSGSLDSAFMKLIP